MHSGLNILRLNSATDSFQSDTSRLVTDRHQSLQCKHGILTTEPPGRSKSLMISSSTPLHKAFSSLSEALDIHTLSYFFDDQVLPSSSLPQGPCPCSDLCPSPFTIRTQDSDQIPISLLNLSRGLISLVNSNTLWGIPWQSSGWGSKLPLHGL